MSEGTQAAPQAPQQQPEQAAAPAPAPASAPAAAATPAAPKRPVDDKPLKSYWYPDRSGNMSEVATGLSQTYPVHIGWATCVLVVALVGAVAVAAGSESVYRIAAHVAEEMHRGGLPGIAAVALLLAGSAYLASVLFFVVYRPPVYLLDFAVYTPPDAYKVNKEMFVDMTRKSGIFSNEAVEFQKKLIERTGLGQETYLPPGLHLTPPEMTLTRAREEAKEVMVGCIDQLFQKTGLKPSDIDIVIVNCSCFCPTPSLSSMIVNHYKMRRDVKNFNLGGMGCSAGAVSVDLAKDLLQCSRYRNKNVLIFSTENITLQWYLGEQKSMMLINTLFRMGGAALVMTNKPALGRISKYRLRSTVRVITAADDFAHNAIVEKQDDKMVHGVSISRDLVKAVGQALKTNLTLLGPQVLPYSEQAWFLIDAALRIISKSYKAKHPDRYLPNFKKAFQHYCIHAGGRAIIDGLEENLKLSEYDVMPSRATLFRYGNTSSSSVWYELNYIEGRGGVKKGDRVWQIAFGSGLKCNSVVWEALVPHKKSSVDPEVMAHY